MERQATGGTLLDKIEIDRGRPVRPIRISVRRGEYPPRFRSTRCMMFARRRGLRKDAPKTLAAAAVAQVKIAFPPDGARVDLGLSDPVSQGPRPGALGLESRRRSLAAEMDRQRHASRRPGLAPANSVDA